MVKFLAGLVLGLLLGRFEWDALVTAWRGAITYGRKVYLWVRTKWAKKK